MSDVTGVIASFDDRRGDGALIVDDGEQLYFHCLSLADGTRTIGVGVRARGRRVVGRLGHDEVGDLRELVESRPSPSVDHDSNVEGTSAGAARD